MLKQAYLFTPENEKGPSLETLILEWCDRCAPGAGAGDQCRADAYVFPRVWKSQGWFCPLAMLAMTESREEIDEF